MQLALANGLAFPCGVAPGFDPSHVAARGNVRISAVVLPNGNAINLLNGKAGTVVGSGSFRIDGAVGPLYDPTSATGNYVSFSLPAIAPTGGYTLAGIFVLKNATTAGSSQIAGSRDQYDRLALYSSGTGSAVYFSAVVNTVVFNFNAGNGGFTWTSANAGQAFFAAFSYAPGSNAANCLIKNLATGQFAAKTITSSATTPGTPTNARLGQQNNSQYICNACIMYSEALLSIPELVSWAQDPWSFWYPRIEPEFQVGSLAALAARFRKTFSAFGSGAGRRQIQGWG